MRILGIDHVGIASGNLAKHVEIFGGRLGLEVHDIEERGPDGGLRSAFARAGDADVEILEDRVPDRRPLPDCFAPRYGSVEMGRRGGILVPGPPLSVPLEPV